MAQSVTFIVAHENNTNSSAATVNLKWLAGVEQISESNQFPVRSIVVLSPLKSIRGVDYFIKYWKGYPFDISIYIQSNSFVLDNTTNTLEQTFSKGLPSVFSKAVSRLVLSDGRTDESLEDVLPLADTI